MGLHKLLTEASTGREAGHRTRSLVRAGKRRGHVADTLPPDLTPAAAAAALGPDATGGLLSREAGTHGPLDHWTLHPLGCVYGV